MVKPASMDELCHEVARALGIAASAVDADSAQGTTQSWDSLGQLKIMIMLQERFGFQPADDQLAGLSSVAQIAAVLGLSKDGTT